MACSKKDRIVALKNELIKNGMSRSDALNVSSKLIDAESNFQIIITEREERKKREAQQEKEQKAHLEKLKRDNREKLKNMSPEEKIELEKLKEMIMSTMGKGTVVSDEMAIATMSGSSSTPAGMPTGSDRIFIMSGKKEYSGNDASVPFIRGSISQTLPLINDDEVVVHDFHIGKTTTMKYTEFLKKYSDTPTSLKPTTNEIRDVFTNDMLGSIINLHSKTKKTSGFKAYDNFTITARNKLERADKAYITRLLNGKSPTVNDNIQIELIHEELLRIHNESQKDGYSYVKPKKSLKDKAHDLKKASELGDDTGSQEATRIFNQKESLDEPTNYNLKEEAIGQLYQYGSAQIEEAISNVSDVGVKSKLKDILNDNYSTYTESEIYGLIDIIRDNSTPYDPNVTPDAKKSADELADSKELIHDDNTKPTAEQVLEVEQLEKNINKMGSSKNNNFSGDTYVDEKLSIEKILETMKEEVMREHDDAPYSQEYIDHVISIDKQIESTMKEVDPDYKVWTSINETDNQDGTQTSGSFSYNEFNNDEDKINVLWNSFSRITTPSEVLLHETIHATLKGVMQRDGRLRNRARILKEKTQKALLSHNIASEVFLNGIVNPTELEIAEAKEKYNYIFSDGSNPEEFLAYFLSNPKVFQSVQNLTIEKGTENESDPVNDSFLTMAKKILNTVLNAIVKGRNPDGKVNDLTMELFNDMAQARVKYESTAGMSLAERASHRFPPVSIPVMFGSRMLDHIMGLLGKMSTPAYNAIHGKLINIFNRIVNRAKGSRSMNGFIDSIMDVKWISKLLRTEVVNSLFSQIFLNESSSDEKSVRQLIRKQEKIKEIELQMRNSLAKDFKNVFSGKEGKAKAEAVTNVINSGLFMLAEKADTERMDRFNIDADYEHDIKEAKSFMSDAQIKQVLDLADFIRTREVKTAGLRLNIESIILSSTPTEVAKGRDLLISAILKNNTDKENSNIKSVLSNKDTLEVVNQYRALRDQKIESMDKNSMGFVDIPFFERINNSNSETRAIKVGTKDEATAIGSSIIEDKPLMTLDGVEYYRYTTLNLSPSKEAGALDSTDKNIDGYKLSTILNKHFAKNKNLTVKERMRMATETIRDAHDDVDIPSNKIIPIYSASGKVVDYIFPYNHNDTYNQLGSGIDPVNNLVDMMYRLNHDTNVHEGRTALLDALGDMNIKKSNSTVKLSTIDGINVPLEYADIHVPKYMALQLAGSRRSSLANLKIVEKTLFGDILPPKPFGTFIEFAEKSLEEIFQKYKSVLAMLNPAIAIGNFMSNMLIAMHTGIGPLDYAEQYKNKWSSLEDFHSNMEKFSDAMNKYYKTQSKEDLDLANIAEGTLRQSEFYHLYEAGHIGGLQDDYESDRTSVILSSADKYKRKIGTNNSMVDKHKELYDIKKRLAYDLDLPIDSKTIESKARAEYRKIFRVPQGASDVFDFLYVAPTSAVGKYAEKFLLYGDIVTKQIVLEKKMKTDDKQAMSDVISDISDLFVNYAMPSGSVLSFFEKVTGALFMKYLFRSMRGYVAHANKVRKNVALTHGFEYTAGVNLSDPHDSVFNQGPIDALSNRVKIDNLDSVGELLATPHITEMFSIGPNMFWKSL